MTLPFCFWLVQQFPNACDDQKAAEQLFQKVQVKVLAEQRAYKGGQGTCEDGGENFPEGKCALLPAKEGSDQGAGQEEQQIDAPGGGWIPILHQGQPKDQQTATADPQSGQKAKDRPYQ